MSELLGLEHVGMVAEGSTLSLSLAPGQSLAILGPAGAGKSRFLRLCAGEEKPERGKVHVRGEVQWPTSPWPKRSRVQSVLGGRRGSEQSVPLLSAVRLWEARQLAISELTPSQYAALEVASVLGADAGLVALDGVLDLLDPWALRSVLDRARLLRTKGISVLATTNRPDIAQEFDALVVLRDQQVRFVGSVDELIRRASVQTLHVVTPNRGAVQALVEPFEVSVTQTTEGVRLQAREGQALAARLLLEGYGDIEYVVTRAPTLDEALRSL